MALSESLFSRDLKEAYKVFIDLCFAPYQGHGKDEGFRTDISKYKDIHTIWDANWDKLFIPSSIDQSSNPDGSEIEKHYNSFVNQFSFELGLGLGVKNKDIIVLYEYLAL